MEDVRKGGEKHGQNADGHFAVSQIDSRKEEKNQRFLRNHLQHHWRHCLRTCHTTCTARWKKGRYSTPARAELNFFKEFHMRIISKHFTIELTQTVVLSILTMITLAT